MLSTLCICIVFVPVFLLQGTAKYLFSPLSVWCDLPLLASLALSFTLVPVLFKYLMRTSAGAHAAMAEATIGVSRPGAAGALVHALRGVHVRFERGFERFRETYRDALAWALAQSRRTIAFFGVLMAASLLLFPFLGRDFFPQVDAGQMRLHVRAPPGTRRGGSAAWRCPSSWWRTPSRTSSSMR